MGILPNFVDLGHYRLGLLTARAKITTDRCVTFLGALDVYILEGVGAKKRVDLFPQFNRFLGSLTTQSSSIVILGFTNLSRQRSSGLHDDGLIVNRAYPFVKFIQA